MEKPPLDLAAIRTRLAESRGPQYWQSLQELADNEEVQKVLHEKFPRQAQGLLDPMTRRTFLQFMGASLALAGLSACTTDMPKKIVPYVKKPEEVVPGKPLFFATAFPDAGYARGVIVTSN